MTVGSAAWRVERATGSAAAFHGRPLGDPVERAVHVWSVDRPALVLGSVQDASVVDDDACARFGVEVVRRRSGGGAVLLEPGTVAWLDIEIPRHDPHWNDDVGRAAWWVGERIGAAVASVGVPDPVVHTGGLRRTPWSDVVCFAGLGPGEVTIGAGGPKVVGLSQRRTRAGARFQCAVLLTWEPSRLVRLLRLEPARRAEALAALEPAAAPVAGGDLDDVVETSLQHLLA